MPLSNDFTNTRLSYLQDAIKNSKIVAEQFYPRFVREYNEQFPFTEPKLSNIGNPISNTGVKGYLNRRTNEQIIEDLSTKIQTLTNNEEITKEIVQALAEQLHISGLNYYDEHFNEIQKQITIPRDGISRQAFIDKVLMALQKEPYKSDVSIYKQTPYITREEEPLLRKHITLPADLLKEKKKNILKKLNGKLPLPSTSEFLNIIEDNNAVKLPKKGKKVRFNDEAPSPDTIKLPKGEKTIFNNKSPSAPLKSDEKNAVKLPDTIKLPKKGKTIFDDESFLDESLPVLQRESVLPLAESVSLVQRKSVLPIPQAVPLMEQVAEKHSNETLPFLEELKVVNGTPIKLSSAGRMAGIPNRKNRIKNPTREQLLQEIKNRLGINPEDVTEEFLNRYETAYTKPDPKEKSSTKAEDVEEEPKKTSTPSKPKTRSTSKSQNLSFGVSSGSYILSNKLPKPKKQFAKGIQLKPLRIQNRIIKHKQVFNNNKYAIDTKKLKKNILDLKYVKNANHVATFQPIEISDKLRSIIDNIIKDFYNVQNEDFNNLNTTEKRILKRLFTFLNIQNNTLNDSSYSDKNDSIQHNFEVAYGSFLAGNNNKELINELIQYVKLALHENNISKKDGYEILKKLNNK